MHKSIRTHLTVKVMVVLGVAAVLSGLMWSEVWAAKQEDSESVPPAKEFRYLCEDGKVFTLEVFTREDCVVLTLEGKPIKLPRVVSGSGAKYSNGKTTVWLKGNEAYIEIDGKIIIKNCRTQN